MFYSPQVISLSRYATLHISQFTQIKKPGLSSSSPLNPKQLITDVNLSTGSPLLLPNTDISFQNRYQLLMPLKHFSSGVLEYFQAFDASLSPLLHTNFTDITVLTISPTGDNFTHNTKFEDFRLPRCFRFLQLCKK